MPGGAPRSPTAGSAGRRRGLEEVDPTLLAGAQLTGRPAPTVRVETLGDGPWRVRGAQREVLLVLEGFLVRRLLVGGAAHAELVGPGDVLPPRPGPAAADRAAGISISWRVLQGAEVAVLDDSVCAIPSVARAVAVRSAERARRLSGQMALTRARRTADRITGLLALLARRFGVPAPDGVLIPVPLTHTLLAELVGAHRPAVTVAARELVDAGKVRREAGRLWVLRGRAT